MTRNLFISRQSGKSHASTDGVICVGIDDSTIVTPRYIEGLFESCHVCQVKFVFNPNCKALYFDVVTRTLYNIGARVETDIAESGGVIIVAKIGRKHSFLTWLRDLWARIERWVL